VLGFSAVFGCVLSGFMSPVSGGHTPHNTQGFKRKNVHQLRIQGPIPQSNFSGDHLVNTLGHT